MVTMAILFRPEPLYRDSVIAGVHVEGPPTNEPQQRHVALARQLNTTLSYSQRRIPAKAVEHVEEPSIVHDVEQAHDFPDPAADHG
jgi:hypothetical protein